MDNQELNRKVCEKLGWEPAPDVGLAVMRNKYTGDLSHKMWLKDYTTDLNACFRDVVPRMGDIELFIRDTYSFVRHKGMRGRQYQTPAEAICRAFLAMEE